MREKSPKGIVIGIGLDIILVKPLTGLNGWTTGSKQLIYRVHTKLIKEAWHSSGWTTMPSKTEVMGLNTFPSIFYFSLQYPIPAHFHIPCPHGKKLLVEQKYYLRNQGINIKVT